MTVRAAGRCVCGAVAYEVRGPLRDILIRHCEECRRWSGHLGAFSATRIEHLVLVEEQGLRWIESPQSDRRASRGFCAECGSSLFWKPGGGERVNIAAGTLDRPTGLRVAGHWYTRHAGDFDALPDDGLPRDQDPATPIRWTLGLAPRPVLPSTTGAAFDGARRRDTAGGEHVREDVGRRAVLGARLRVGSRLGPD